MCLFVGKGSKLISLSLRQNQVAPRSCVGVGAGPLVFCPQNLIMHQSQDKIPAGAQGIRTEDFSV